MPERRPEISAQELHWLLSGAFNRIRPMQCRSCEMPLPVPSSRPTCEAANWTLPVSMRCEHNCASFMRWLAAQYARKYDLVDAE